MISVPSHIASLKPYKPGRSAEDVERELGLHNVIKLASNENPFGSSPMGIEGIRKSLSTLERYPDQGRALSTLLADRYVVTPSNVICASGSESILEIALSTFLDEGDEMVTSEGTFIGFQVLAHRFGRTTHYVPHKKYHFDLEGMLAKVNDKTKIIYIANPNNPTGTIVSTAELESFMEKVPKNVLVILDEAYFEYAVAYADFPDSMRWRWDNVLTCRTFSKAYGLAGMRIGYGMAHSDVIAQMLKVRLSFEPSAPASAAGIGALEDREFLKKSVDHNRESLRYYHTEFERLGLDFVPSLGNFVMIDFGSEEHASRIHEGMLNRGVITRPLHSFGLPACIRISTGLQEENERCVTALEEVLSEESVG